MMLNAGFSTLETLKARLLPEASQDDTTWDAALGTLGKAIAQRMQAHCNRLFCRAEDVTDEFAAATTAVTLRRYPVESIESVQIREYDGTLGEMDAGYVSDDDAGLIEFFTIPGGATQRIVVTYTGGFWLDDGEAMPDGATPLPDDLMEAWIAEVQHHAEARGLFEAVGLRSPKDAEKRGETNGLTEAAIAALRPYRRFSGA